MHIKLAAPSRIECRHMECWAALHMLPESTQVSIRSKVKLLYRQQVLSSDFVVLSFDQLGEHELWTAWNLFEEHYSKHTWYWISWWRVNCILLRSFVNITSSETSKCVMNSKEEDCIWAHVHTLHQPWFFKKNLNGSNFTLLRNNPKCDSEKEKAKFPSFHYSVK